MPGLLAVSPVGMVRTGRVDGFAGEFRWVLTGAVALWRGVLRRPLGWGGARWTVAGYCAPRWS